MATKAPLLYVVRLNWLAPDKEEEWNQFYNQQVMPAVLKRPGFIRGARYKMIKGPEYLGWEGPSRAYQYLHIYEIEDSGAALQSALHPPGSLTGSLSWGGNRPMMDMLLAVAAVYRRITGQIELPSLIYMTRYEILSPERKEEWNRFYDGVALPRLWTRPGLKAGARHVIQRGPECRGWVGPESSSQYFNMFEVIGEEWIDKVMPSLEMIRSWDPNPPFPIGSTNEVRGIYRRIALQSR